MCYIPLEADEGSGGAPADHLIVKMEPINMINNKAARTYSKITVRPMPKSAMDQYKMEIDVMIGVKSILHKVHILRQPPSSQNMQK